MATLFDGDPGTLAVTDLVGADYDREAATTGFPLLVTSHADHRRWRRDYLRSVVPETLAESDHVVDDLRLARLIEGLAGCVGHELVLTHLVSDLSIDRRTAARYLDLLEEMRLIRRLPGLRRKATDTERAVPKLHMVDPILVAPDPGGPSDDRRGALLESFVVNELATQLEWVDGADGLFHWRDRSRETRSTSSSNATAPSSQSRSSEPGRFRRERRPVSTRSGLAIETASGAGW